MNSVNQNLKGKRVLMLADAMPTGFEAPLRRVVKVVGGFGASPYTHGRSMDVIFECDGELRKLNGEDVERVLDDNELTQPQTNGDTV